MALIPAKLEYGDEIRVISPSYSLAIITQANRKTAVDRFNSLGLSVSFSKYAEESDEFHSSSISSRIRDLHDAFSDKTIKAIFTTIGGYNSNQLLRHIDFDVIRDNPKILCGYSDITALSNAIYAKTGLVSYSGPHFSTLGMIEGLEHTLEYMRKCLFDNNAFCVCPSTKWSDDPWYKYQAARKFHRNKGYIVINPGSAEGTIIGGNLCTLNLLQGTGFMPSLKGAILFLEDDKMAGSNTDVEFDRNLQSLLHLPDAAGIRGLVIGRFQKASKMTAEKITRMIKTKKELENIPVIAGVDFGHTTPQITFPIGGRARLEAGVANAQLIITEH